LHVPMTGVNQQALALSTSILESLCLLHHLQTTELQAFTMVRSFLSILQRR
jgi:hypothetical protein